MPHMIWCGDVEAQGRMFHACVYVSDRPPFQNATVRHIARERLFGETFNPNLENEQQDSLLSELQQVLRKKTRTGPS